MGGTYFNEQFHSTATATRAAAGVAGRTTVHTKAVAEGKAAALHPKMNPHGVEFRESRDSAAHPNSVAIVVQFDVTGSMGQFPVQMQAHLPVLPGTLVRGGYVPDAAIMMMAVGDAFCDTVPLQVGQFESGNEMDEDLDRIYVEGRGSPGDMDYHESYELGMYFVARHTATDCWEKRKKKGYYFIIGDEMPYPVARRDQVVRHVGQGLEADVKVEALVKELQERYHVIFLLAGTRTGKYPPIRARWTELLGGENVVDLPTPQDTASVIAAFVASHEKSLGVTPQAAAAPDPAAAAGKAKRL